MYGCDPMNEDPFAHGLEPALELSSYVAAVKRATPGESAGYGRRWVADAETWAQPSLSGNRIFVKDVSTLALWTLN